MTYPPVEGDPVYPVQSYPPPFPQPYAPPYAQPYPGYAVHPAVHPAVPVAPRRVAPAFVGWALVVFGGLVVLAATLPWVEVAFLGTRATKLGVDGDGRITLALGVVVVLLGLLVARGAGVLWTTVVAAAVGVVVAVVAAVDLADVRDLVGTHGAFDVTVDVGTGLVLTLAGGLAVTATATVGILRRSLR